MTILANPVINPEWGTLDLRWTIDRANEAFGALDAEVSGGGGGGIGDAPVDGTAYGRLNGAWANVLPLAGGVLTGLLTLGADPINPLDAATKEYVDNGMAGGPFLPLTGGTVSGLTNFQGGLIATPWTGVSGSQYASAANDVTKHLCFYPYPQYPAFYGINVTSGQMNFVLWNGGVTPNAPGVGMSLNNTGALNVGSSNSANAYDAAFSLCKNVSGRYCMIKGYTGALSNVTGAPPGTGLRWSIYLGNNAAETGSNVGSDFAISNYDDNGNLIARPLQITRSTGTVNLNGATFATAANGGVTIPTSFNVSGVASFGNLIVTNNYLQDYTYTNNAIVYAQQQYKARGTPAAPAQVQTNDQVFNAWGYAYNGSTFVNVAQIQAVIYDPNVGTASPSTALGTGFNFLAGNQGTLSVYGWFFINRQDFLTGITPALPVQYTPSTCAWRGLYTSDSNSTATGAMYAGLTADAYNCKLILRVCSAYGVNGGVIDSQTGRGNLGAPTVSLTNDIAFNEKGWAYNGSAFTQITSVQHKLIEPTPSATAMGSQLVFNAVKPSTVTLATILQMDFTNGARFGGPSNSIDPGLGGLSATGATLQLRKTASGQANNIQGHTGTGTAATTLKWQLTLGDTTAESGSNAGSNFALAAYADGTGALLGNVMTAVRSTQIVTFAQTIVNGSDARWKENVVQIPGALAIVGALTGVRYTVKGAQGRPQIGLIAQDVQKVLPEVVMETGDQTVHGETYENALGVAYAQIVAVLIEAIKELKGRVEQLEAKAA